MVHGQDGVDIPFLSNVNLPAAHMFIVVDILSAHFNFC